MSLTLNSKNVYCYFNFLFRLKFNGFEFLKRIFLKNLCSIRIQIFQLRFTVDLVLYIGVRMKSSRRNNTRSHEIITEAYFPNSHFKIVCQRSFIENLLYKNDALKLIISALRALILWNLLKHCGKSCEKLDPLNQDPKCKSSRTRPLEESRSESTEIDGKSETKMSKFVVQFYNML